MMVLNEEQRLLQDTVRRFLHENAPPAALRKLRDTRDKQGYSPELWRDMAALGLAGILLPEELGGADFGCLGAGLVMEESGRHLSASPFFSTAVLGASLLLAADTPHARERLKRIAAGEYTLALALEEGSHHDPYHIALRATKKDDGWQLDGAKTQVLDGHCADGLIVVARTIGEERDREGLSLFLVDGDAAGLTRHRRHMIDSRNSAHLQFRAVQLPSEALLPPRDQAHTLLDPLLDRACVMLAAELLGICEELFERTIQYLKDREQFGVKIGSFQALQHRAAKMFVELQLARPTVQAALSALQKNTPEAPLLASLAKARLNDTAHLVSHEAIQMHGGIGMTDELEIGLFYKRTRMLLQLFGTAGLHRDRYATLRGF